MSEPPRHREDMREQRPSRAARRRRLRRQRLAALAVLVIAVGALAFGARALFTDADAASSGGSPQTSAVAASKAKAGKTPAAGTETPAAASGESSGEAMTQTATPSPTPSATGSPAPKVIEIGWVGDTTPGSKYGLPPDSGRALFVRGAQAAAGPRPDDRQPRGHLLERRALQVRRRELRTPASPSRRRRRTPRRFAWAGIDLVSVANNHTYDYFARGLRPDHRRARRRGSRVRGAAGQVTVRGRRGVRVAVVAFSPYSWNANVNDIPGGGEARASARPRRPTSSSC